MKYLLIASLLSASLLSASNLVDSKDLACLVQTAYTLKDGKIVSTKKYNEVEMGKEMFHLALQNRANTMVLGGGDKLKMVGTNNEGYIVYESKISRVTVGNKRIIKGSTYYDAYFTAIDKHISFRLACMTTPKD